MPPFKYVSSDPGTVLDTASLAWVPRSEPAVAAAIAAGQVLPADPPPPRPFVPDFGGEADDDATFRGKSQAAVNDLRAYLALSSPTATQSAAALKLLIRVVLFLVRRAL